MAFFIGLEGASPIQCYIATVASGIIGAVTTTGSVLAYMKLQGKFGDASTNPILKFGNATFLTISVIIGIILVLNPQAWWLYWLLAITALAVRRVLRDADRRRRYAGGDLAAELVLRPGRVCDGLRDQQHGADRFSGALVGASGLILTQIMCVAMNRSLFNVLFSVMAAGGSSLSDDEVYAGKVKSTSGDEVAMLLDGVQRVCIVPGYGMAVSQSQHIVRDIANVLGEQDVEVTYGVHPVAGRMPGHMNVLLAEADVPYEQLHEMDQVNQYIEQVDVCIVLGANDVVNPEARTNPDSPIAGMPIIDVDKARTCIVIKRSLSAGFAGIPNPLFAMDNTLMLFGDGKAALNELLEALKEA